MRTRVISTAAILLWAAIAQARGITASADRTEAQVGDRIRLTLTVEGSSRAVPQPPPLPAFDVYTSGQSTQMQIVNGRMTTSIAHNYVLVPKKAGAFTVGPASVEIDGRVYQSRPFTVRIQASGETAPSDGPRDLFATARISNRTPYVGEQIIYTLRFFQRVQTRRVTLEQGEFDGFVSHDLGEQRVYDTTVKGVQYRVTELRKALFAQEAGPLTVPAATLEAEVVVRSQRRRRRSFFDDFFDGGVFGHETRAHTVRSGAIEVTVRPLPPAPPTFTGLVGAFDVKANLSRTSAAVGESTTLTIEVSGRGNAQSIVEPPLVGLESFKTYDDKPTANLSTGKDGVWGSKTFRKALVPLQEGELRVPPVAVTYFDPQAQQYRTKTSAPMVIVALPPTGTEELGLTEFVAPSTGKVAVKILADDILPIYRKVDALWTHGVAGRDRLLFGGGLALPVIGFVGLFGFRRRKERLAGDTAYRRRSRAAGRAARILKQVATCEKAGDEAGAAEAASRAVRELVGDILNIEGGALTHGDTAEHLRGRGVSDKVIADVESLLAACDAARYGGHASDQLSGLHDRVKRLLRTLERSLRG